MLQLLHLRQDLELLHARSGAQGQVLPRSRSSSVSPGCKCCSARRLRSRAGEWICRATSCFRKSLEHSWAGRLKRKLGATHGMLQRCKLSRIKARMRAPAASHAAVVRPAMLTRIVIPLNRQVLLSAQHSCTLRRRVLAHMLADSIRLPVATHSPGSMSCPVQERSHFALCMRCTQMQSRCEAVCMGVSRSTVAMVRTRKLRV